MDHTKMGKISTLSYLFIILYLALMDSCDGQVCMKKKRFIVTEISKRETNLTEIPVVQYREEFGCCRGYLQAGKEMRCQVCPSWLFGYACRQKCRCVRENTRVCHHVTGFCQCYPGWFGKTCARRFGRRPKIRKRAATEDTDITGQAPAELSLQPDIVCIVNCDFPTTTIDISSVICSICDGANTASCGSDTNFACVCKPGYTGTTCSSTCSQGTYGDQCAMNCECFSANTESCDHVTGACTCKPGYQGTICNTVCADGTYGAGCTEQCHCVAENTIVCNKTTGCYCDVGWQGTNCTQVCDPFKYGKNCDSLCPCVQSNSLSCDVVNGTCNCIPGYEGSFCNESCPSFTYGENCTQTCNCDPNHAVSCSTVDGNCTCSAGWTGTSCTNACAQWTYGELCAADCLCNLNNTETCDNVNGTCTCKPGYIGDTCEQECASGFYGQDCQSECACNVNNSVSCNHVTGYCTCVVGYDQPDCTQVCAGGTYGDQCSQKCSCPSTAYSVCHHINGTCTCLPGYVGDTCQTACPENTFGVECIGVCNCVAEHTASCDKGTGACICTSGWQGTTCDSAIPAVTFALTDAPVLIGVFGFLVAILLTAIIGIVLWFVCRCSCAEFKHRSRHKKGFSESTGNAISTSERTNGRMMAMTSKPTTTALSDNPKKTAAPEPAPNDNVYYARDVLNNSSEPSSAQTANASAPSGGDEYYYTDGISAAASANSGVKTEAGSDKPPYSKPNKPGAKVDKTPLQLPPVAPPPPPSTASIPSNQVYGNDSTFRKQSGPLYGNLNVKAQETYETLGGQRGGESTYDDLH